MEEAKGNIICSIKKKIAIKNKCMDTKGERGEWDEMGDWD